MPDATAVTPGATPDWRELVEVEIMVNPRGKAGVAALLDYDRSYVSRALATGHTSSGFPNGVPQSFIERVLHRLYVVECPVTRERQLRYECGKGNGAAPTHNPLAMRIWIACQTCPHKPAPEIKP